jgi:predicted neutral ceramidase superfamily lipid hydrolase
MRELDVIVISISVVMAAYTAYIRKRHWAKLSVQKRQMLLLVIILCIVNVFIQLSCGHLGAKR